MSESFKDGDTANSSSGSVDQPGNTRTDDALATPQYHSTLKMLVIFSVVAVAIRLVFMLYTDREWEDALITITHALNAVEGNGLTHHPGEGRVHGFTSALSVLIPLVGEWVWRGAAMLTLQIASLAASVMALTYAWLIGRSLSVSKWPMCFLLAYLALDQNQIFYGMAGMETQVATAVLLAGIYHVMVADMALSGVFLGLGLLARPDFAIWVGLAMLFLLIRNPKRFHICCLTALAVFGPWLLFTWLYYGTPVPHTITAKSQNFFHPPTLEDPLGYWTWWINNRLKFGLVGFVSYFTPFFENDLTHDVPFHPRIYKTIGYVFAFLSVVGGVLAAKRPAFRPAVAYFVAFILYRAFCLPFSYYGWYYPPVMAVAAILTAITLSEFNQVRPPASRYDLRWIGPVLACVLAVAFAFHIPFSFPVEAKIQHEIEDKVRKPLAQYLRREIKPGESVASESAGYVGYYSRATLYDFPGLTSPRSREVLTTAPPKHRELYYLVATIKPDWVVFRSREHQQFVDYAPDIAKSYAVEKVFSADPDISHWGLNYRNSDRYFLLMRKKKPAPETPGPVD